MEGLRRGPAYSEEKISKNVDFSPSKNVDFSLWGNNATTWIHIMEKKVRLKSRKSHIVCIWLFSHKFLCLVPGWASWAYAFYFYVSKYLRYYCSIFNSCNSLALSSSSTFYYLFNEEVIQFANAFKVNSEYNWIQTFFRNAIFHTSK